MHFTWLTPPGPYRATTCRERELTLDNIYILFWPHKDIEGLSGWGIGSMPGPPPRQHKHERRYTPFTHPFIPTRRIRGDDYDGQVLFGDLVGLKLPDTCLTSEEKPKKNLTQKTCPDRESNLVPLRDRRIYVDEKFYIYNQFYTIIHLTLFSLFLFLKSH